MRASTSSRTGRCSGGCLSELEIVVLRTTDASRLAALLADGDAVYQQHFSGLSADRDTLAPLLDGARKDRFWGMQDGARLMALAMVRGLDAGYRVPAFGVYVGQAYAHKGLGTLALDHAIAWCRLNGHPELMLSVHLDNTVARSMYERRGFAWDGDMSVKGHRIYRLSLT